jgi:AmiR/NasT family two-component response regulator
MERREDQLAVLVVEDDYLVSLEVVRTAEEAGFKVLGVASDGLEALDLVRKTSPQAVLLDIQMPGMNGFEVARRIRDEMPTPVVIMTAYEGRELIAEAKAAGVGAYLTKPPKVSSVTSAVEIAVARHEDMMELRRVNEELKNALQQVKTLTGLLPICSHCKKVRDDTGYWQQVEDYVSGHADVEFSHGVCPDCVRKHYAEFADAEDC